MTMDPLDGTAAEIAALVSRGTITARDVTRRALDRISQLDERVNAFTDVTAVRALAEADAVDARVAAGEVLPLAGVPYAVKNLCDLEGVTTRAGSKINRDNSVAGHDATVVAKLKAAGAVCLGALNMGEYAYDFTGRNAHDGDCRNPHDLGRMTGGSSSGSGAAVAAGMVALAIGSDTNGSIRVPSSFCGTFGLKPTFGRISRARSFPFTASLDHLGPFARSAADLALAFDALQGPDPLDPHQADRPVLATAGLVGAGTAGLRIAIAGGYFRGQGFDTADRAVDAVAAALGTDRIVEIPEAARARAAAFLITNVESATLHLSRIRSRPGDFDPETRDRFIAGTMVPAGWYVAAQRFRSWYRAAVNRLFEEVDVVLAPATPFPALGLDETTMTVNGKPVLARQNIGIFTQPISFAGLPVASVPIWLAGERMPIGVQVIAAPWREDVALRVAAALEAAGVAKAPIAMVEE
ncbi:AtzE family amidohydrolase [Oharaeibacter diazotrophicus]|uniref:Aspartyl-tRNA(Asn)/glutamyl-tRNA(Gln) amidotransferase subunit A n=1 Tax=Oharaeibacter diazotrophicus TaxID=1920512 RepID=A0A4R6RM15_9HYPH|nr:AtzE family amidohydrolase [Oharaeibacter diazotrophicus]TDP87713.1 aspartyl-tRNA(Asn)/glutamyl-tRNA(Gln) amidotransferase subunit A [Oharaeibacter diazotrophicus]BBE74705.1 biuret hydrolase [Pleomorphomonas sp. SM30]GLS77087.1 amidase [Oharaeibacter diazotrophicus]